MSLADRNYNEADMLYRMPQTIKNSRGGYTRDTPKALSAKAIKATVPSFTPDPASMRFIEQNGVGKKKSVASKVKTTEKGISKMLKNLWS